MLGTGLMVCMEMTAADMSENDEVLRAFPMFLRQTWKGLQQIGVILRRIV